MTQSRTDPPVAADRASRRSATRKRRAPLALILAPVALVAVGVVLLLVLGGGDGGPLGGIIGDDDESDVTPPFDFRGSKTAVVATVPEADVDALKTQAETITDDVTPVIDDLYTNGFLDPTNWREGDYEEVFALFTDEAAPAAEQGVETLTLGVAAGDVFETVTPERGSLRFNVLFDPGGAPTTVVVKIRFVALGERQDGTFLSIVSSGSMFLEDSGGWRITAFDVDRDDKETPAPSPSPAPSGSPT
ncbi:MAG: hypothetical protein ACXWX6_08470 [Actinomycetota bacterium]